LGNDGITGNLGEKMAKLYFYYSTMNAGKSTTLLQSSYNYRERDMNTLVYTAAIDDRFGVGKVTSRIGISQDAFLFRSETNLFDEINERGQTILMVTHSTAAASRAKRVLFIKDGILYNQIYRGEKTERQMFQEISDTLTVMASEVN